MQKIAMALLFGLATSAYAQEPAPVSTVKTIRFWAGYGYHEGSRRSRFNQTESDPRITIRTNQLSGGITYRWGQASAERSWYPDSAGTHGTSLELTHQLLPVDVVRIGLDIKHAEFSETDVLFSSGGTHITGSGTRQVQAIGLHIGLGAYDKSKFRIRALYGKVSTSDTLSVLIGEQAIPSPADITRSGQSNFLAAGTEFAIQKWGFAVSGSAMHYMMQGAEPHPLEDQFLLKGSASYISPLHVGVKVEGTWVRGAKAHHPEPLFFLSDSISASVIVRIP